MYKEEDINKALEVLRSGGIILYPTDTIWGLGCDATDGDAVKRIFDIKKRADGKALISLIDSTESLEGWVENIPDSAKKEIADAKTPTTIIYDRPVGIADELKAEDGSAAFRIPLLQFAKDLSARFGKPLVSTSANISGSPSPGIFNEISEEVRGQVDYIVEYGRDLPAGQPSRILKITDSGEVKTIR